MFIIYQTRNIVGNHQTFALKPNIPASRMQFQFKPATDYERNKFQLETTIYVKIPQKTTQKVPLLADMPLVFEYNPTSIYKFKDFQGLINPTNFNEFPDEDPSLFVVSIARFEDISPTKKPRL
jgi:hypothetical protein